MKGRILALMLAGLEMTAGFPAFGAAPLHGALPLPVAPDISILTDWTRYSERGSRELLGMPVDPARRERELARLADRIRPEVAGDPGGAGVPEAFRRVLIREEGFAYDSAAGNPGNYLIDTVLARKRGNCLGLSLLWLSLAERLDLPFRGVYVPGHCFVRFEGEATRVNVEFSDGGAPWEDGRFRKEFRVPPDRPYLHSLSRAEMLAVFLKSLGAAYAKKGRDEEALEFYAEAERLSPGLPDATYNAGVSLQKLGRSGEAIAKYRKALAIDPDMAPARDNLGILLAKGGRYAEAIAEARKAVELEPWNAATRGNLAAAYCGCGRLDEGIREYRVTLKMDPGNRKAQSGLARAFFAKGAYHEAAAACDLAESLGCVFDPLMLRTLRPYREGRTAAEGTP